MLTEKEKEVVKEMAEAFATAVQGEQQTLLRTLADPKVQTGAEIGRGGDGGARGRARPS